MFVSSFFSVVGLDEVQSFPVAGVGLLHAEQILVSAHGSSKGEALIAEQIGTGQETTHNTVGEAASGKQKPVEVVCCPELLEEHSFPHDSLLLRSVQTASIDDGKLEPGGLRVAVGLAGLISEQVSSGGVSGLSTVSESITAVVL